MAIDVEQPNIRVCASQLAKAFNAPPAFPYRASNLALDPSEYLFSQKPTRLVVNIDDYVDLTSKNHTNMLPIGTLNLKLTVHLNNAITVIAGFL
ncbi:hypothetical protein QR680_011800 [Steinernema hermaphroditum]|uniref:Uncharacterized protein n=1 Tax=Steinernema hermaphroditum TaxID=289476 RepID=A0AA39HZS6_9BILA|nr:hypothetical protein QR680_011800 [Steinernema hermaphroditum]